MFLDKKLVRISSSEHGASIFVEGCGGGLVEVLPPS